MSQSFGITASRAAIALRGSSSPGSISNGIASRLSPRIRCRSRSSRGLSRDAMRERLRANLGGRRLARAQRLVEAREDRLDANEAIGLDVDVGRLLAVA